MYNQMTSTPEWHRDLVATSCASYRCILTWITISFLARASSNVDSFPPAYLTIFANGCNASWRLGFVDDDSLACASSVIGVFMVVSFFALLFDPSNTGLYDMTLHLLLPLDAFVVAAPRFASVHQTSVAVATFGLSLCFSLLYFVYRPYSIFVPILAFLAPAGLTLFVLGLSQLLSRLMKQSDG